MFASRSRSTSLRSSTRNGVRSSFDAIVGLHVEVLDGHVLAVGQDHEPAGRIVVEAEAARLLDVELAAHALVVGARLYEQAL